MSALTHERDDHRPRRQAALPLVRAPRRSFSATTTPNGAFRSATTGACSRSCAWRVFSPGLSWRTILAKRENFRAAFHDFDFDRIARFTARDVERLLKDEGIVRHRGKIEAVINNARRARELVKREGSLAAFIWRYEPDAKQLAKPQTASTSRGIDRAVEGPQEAGLEVRRTDHGLCLHAGHGADQRPCRGLRDQSQGRARAQEFQAARTLRFTKAPAALLRPAPNVEHKVWCLDQFDSGGTT